MIWLPFYLGVSLAAGRDTYWLQGLFCLVLCLAWPFSRKIYFLKNFTWNSFCNLWKSNVNETLFTNLPQKTLWSRGGTVEAIKGLERLISIWTERNVYDATFLVKLHKCLGECKWVNKFSIKGIYSQTSYKQPIKLSSWGGLYGRCLFTRV